MLTTLDEPSSEPAPQDLRIPVRRHIGPAWLRRPRAGEAIALWNRLLIVAGVVVYGVFGWQQRWISDDGLIALRTVRQLLAGNGPVFNVGERVEVNTSTVWTAVLTVVGAFPNVQLEMAAVVIGLLCAVAGLGIGMDAARRLHLPDGGAVLLPLGAAVLLAVPPFRDFATSGLETGLVTLWLGGSWWLLVRIARGDRDGPFPWSAALVFGLGPLVRPDLGIFAVLGFVLMLGILRPRPPVLLGLLLSAGGIPVIYQIFRAGYYGLLVPNTALAKEASRARWSKGIDYLDDMVSTYWLWIPLATGLIVLAVLAWRRAGGWSDGWATVAVGLLPVAAGLVMALYVVRVGGDFMHGRMLLPALTAVALPLLVVPLTRWTLVPLIGIAVWVTICAAQLRVEYGSQLDVATGIVDERGFWSGYVDSRHPLSAEQFIEANGVVRRSVPAVQRVDEPALMLVQPGAAYSYWRPLPARDGVDHITISYINLGMMGAAHPLHVRVVDGVGLANPLAAHATPIFGARIGHDKDLPVAWYLADEVRTGEPTPGYTRDAIHARVALRCPEIAEFLDSVREPLTVGRFWDNLIGAPHRTGVRFPRDPVLASGRC